MSVSVLEGKALKLLLAKYVSSVDDTVHIDGGVGFLPCTMVNVAEVEVPKLFGVSIGLKRCRTECRAELKGDQMQIRAQTQTHTQLSQELDGSLVFHARTKYIEIKHDFIREKGS